MTDSVEKLRKLVLLKDWEAMNLAEQIGEMAAPMLKELMGNADGEIRDLTLGCLVLTNDKQVTKILAQALSDPDQDVRMRAILALESRYDHTILPELLLNLDNIDTDIRIGVAKLIGNLRDSSAIQPLHQRVTGETDEAAKRQMKLALAKLGDENLKTEFANQLDVSDSKTRYEGIRDLGYIDDKKLARRLLPALQDRGEAYDVGEPDKPHYARVCDAAINLVAKWIEKPFSFPTDDLKIYSDVEIKEAKRFLNSLENQK